MTTKTLVDSLYIRFGRRILKIILKRNGGDLVVAEDILSDTFTAVLKSFHTFQNKSSYFTWLTRIALNKMADYYRRKIHRDSRIFVPSVEYFNSLIDPKITPEEEVTLAELRIQVQKSLALLPKEYQQLLDLKYLRDLSNREIQIKLNLSPRQLEGRLYRSKKAFAKILKSP